MDISPQIPKTNKKEKRKRIVLFLVIYCFVVIAGCAAAAMLSDHAVYTDHPFNTEVADSLSQTEKDQSSGTSGKSSAEEKNGSEAETVELKDGESIDFVFTVPGGIPAGIRLEGFDANELILTDEVLKVSVYQYEDRGEGPLLQTSGVNLHDVLARNTDVNSSRIYVPFDTNVRAFFETENEDSPDAEKNVSEASDHPSRAVMVRLETTGLETRGILLGVSLDAADEYKDCRLLLNGNDRGDLVLKGGIFTVENTSGCPSSIVSAGAAFLAIGVLLAFLACVKEIPFRCRKGINKKENDQGDDTEDGKKGSVDLPVRTGSKRLLFISFLVSAGGMICAAVWGYYAGVRNASRRLVPEVSAVSNDTVRALWRQIPSEDGELNQTFTAKGNDLSGVGLILAGTDGKATEDRRGKTDSAAASGEASDENQTAGEGLYALRLLDRDGTVLRETIFSIADLDPVPDVVSQTDISLSGVLDQYLYIPFDEAVPDSEGNVYQISLAKKDDSAAGETDLFASCLPEQKGGGMQVLTLYQGYRNLPFFYLVVVIVAGAFLLLPGWILWLRPIHERNSHDSGAESLKRGKTGRAPGLLKVFFFLFVGSGAAMSVSIPFYSAPDEKAHINTVYQLSNRLLGVPSDIGPGYVLESREDAEILTMVDSVGVISYHPMMVESLFQKEESSAIQGSAGWTELLSDVGDAGESGPAYKMEIREPVYYQNTLGNATIFHYLPALLGFTLGRLLGFNLPTRILFARWANLTACAFMVYYGIMRCPVGQKALACIALFPMFLQMAASCSYDAMLLGSAFLFIGYCLHVLTESDISLYDLLMLCLSGALLLSSKQGVYLPVLCLILLAPVFRKRALYRRMDLAVLFVGALFLSFGFLPGFIRDFLLPSSAYVQNYYSLAELLRDPGTFIGLLGATAAKEAVPLMLGMVGDGLASFYVRLPLWLTLWMIILAVISALTGGKESRVTLDGGARGWIALVTAIGILFLNLAALFGMTPKGANQITGLQGRYFLPYAALLGILLTPGKKKNDRLVQTKRSSAFTQNEGTGGRDPGMTAVLPDLLLQVMALPDFVSIAVVFASLYGG